MGLTAGSALTIRGGMFWGGLLFFLLLESFASYRPNTVSKKTRVATNLLIALFNGVILNLLFWSATVKTLLSAEVGHAGLLNLVNIPYWAKLAVTVIFMDFAMYIWHLANHVMPFLWRFHRVHHSDINMDVSTASRFHIGELLISAGMQIAAFYAIGADIAGVVFFDCILVFAAQFQHSSVRVPEWFERAWWSVFVPPSMHRIHHSVVIRERNRNYGSIFSVWDRLFGTLLRNVRQEGIIIGLGPYRLPGRLNIWNLLHMPFTRPIR